MMLRVRTQEMVPRGALPCAERGGTRHRRRSPGYNTPLARWARTRTRLAKVGQVRGHAVSVKATKLQRFPSSREYAPGGLGPWRDLGLGRGFLEQWGCFRVRRVRQRNHCWAADTNSVVSRPVVLRHTLSRGSGTIRRRTTGCGTTGGRGATWRGAGAFGLATSGGCGTTVADTFPPTSACAAALVLRDGQQRSVLRM